MNPRTKAELFLLACTLIWGGTFVTVKSSLTDVSPLTLIALRFGIAAALFIPFCLSTLLKIDKPAALKGWMLGLLLFASFATQTIGLEYTSASKSGFITGMLVVFTPIFQLLIERRPPKLGNVIGVILVTLGLYCTLRTATGYIFRPFLAGSRLPLDPGDAVDPQSANSLSKTNHTDSGGHHFFGGAAVFGGLRARLWQ